MRVFQVEIWFIMFLALIGTTPAIAGIPSVYDSEFQSATLEEVVGLQVSLPVGYEKTTRDYPVLYLLDGEFFMLQTVSAVDFLSTPRYMNAVIPGYIIVGITTADRNHDFTPTHDEDYDGMPFPTSGGAAAFRRFLAEELIPFVGSTYRVTDRRVLAGWSLGGLFTVWTYLEHPETFGTYLAISPSLWWDDEVIVGTAREIASKDGLSPRRLTVTLGSLERAPMDESVEGAFLPVMANPGVGSNFEFIEIAGEGHNTSPPTALHRGLVSLHRLTLIPDEIVEGDPSQLIGHLIEMAASRGLPTDDPDEAGRFLVKMTVEQGTYDIGLQISQILAERITVSPRSMVAVGEMMFRLNRHQESAEAFKTAIAREEALDHPDPEELKFFNEYLDWVQIRMN